MTASDHKIIGVKKSTLLIAGALLAVSLALNLIIIGGMVSYKSWRHEHAAGKYDYEKIEKFILRQFPQEQSVEVAEFWSATGVISSGLTAFIRVIRRSLPTPCVRNRSAGTVWNVSRRI